MVTYRIQKLHRNSRGILSQSS